MTTFVLVRGPDHVPPRLKRWPSACVRSVEAARVWCFTMVVSRSSSKTVSLSGPSSRPRTCCHFLQILCFLFGSPHVCFSFVRSTNLLALEAQLVHFGLYPLGLRLALVKPVDNVLLLPGVGHLVPDKLLVAAFNFRWVLGQRLKIFAAAVPETADCYILNSSSPD